MTMLLVSNGVGLDELGTNSGYSSLIDWVDEQGDKFPLLAHLIDHGWIDDLPGLAKELNQTKADGDVADAIDRIREAVKTAAGKTLQITNGLVEDDGSEEEGYDEEGEDSDE